MTASATLSPLSQYHLVLCSTREKAVGEVNSGKVSQVKQARRGCVL